MRKAERNAEKPRASGSHHTRAGLHASVFCFGAILLIFGFTENLCAQNRTVVYALQFQERDSTAGINFYCARSYGIDKCKRHAVVLRDILKHHSVQAIAPWSFILIPSGEWNEVLGQASGPAGSPAFSALHSRDTFLSETLFAPTVLEQAEQIQLFGLHGEVLLDFTVAHEFAHAACDDRNEFRANSYASHFLHTAAGEPRVMPSCSKRR
jgi:hypothetical protein